MSGKLATGMFLPEFFRFGIYKPNQGRMVRQSTFFAILIIAAFGCLTLANGPLVRSSQTVRVGLPLGIWLLTAWVAFRIVNVPRFADFLISVESELERVTWPERREVVQATMVVLCTMLFMGTFLFLTDLLWTWFFNLIGFTEYNVS